MELEKLNQNVEIISELGDTPNTDNDLSATELKQKFDEAAKIIKAYLNDSVVPFVNSLSEAASQTLDPTLTREDLAAQAKAAGDAIALRLRLDGTDAMTGNLNMGNFCIANMADPTNETDAANKKYVDAHVDDKDNPHNVTAAQIGAAKTSHTHGAGDITRGTLPVERGGTGVATLNDLKSNLGFTANHHSFQFTSSTGDMGAFILSKMRDGTLNNGIVDMWVRFGVWIHFVGFVLKNSDAEADWYASFIAHSYNAYDYVYHLRISAGVSYNNKINVL